MALPPRYRFPVTGFAGIPSELDDPGSQGFLPRSYALFEQAYDTVCNFLAVIARC
jgi:hypothetical protein